MRYSALALAAAMAATPAFAEVGVADFPGCASTCAVVSTSTPKDTGCTITDLKCVCRSSLYVQQVRNCLENPPSGTDKCSAADMQKTLQVSSELCSQAGYPLQQDAAASGSSSAAASGSSTASGSATSSMTGSSASGSTDASMSSTMTDGSMSMSTMTGTASTSSMTDASGSTTSSADATGSTGAAEPNAKIGMGFLALAGLAAAAL